MGVATPKAPNRAAKVSGVALSGRRTSSIVPRGERESASDRKTNTRSSNNTENLNRQNQRRNGM